MMAGADWLNLHFDREREGRHVTLHVAHLYREEGRRVRGYITIHSIHSYYILIDRGRGEKGGKVVRRDVLLH